MAPDAPPDAGLARERVTGLDDAGFGTAPGTPPLPFAAPGDHLRRTEAGLRVIPGDGRAEPPCPLFGRCGGCALQHVADGTYARWKAGRVRQALGASGIEAPMLPMHRSPLASRRRATFTAVLEGKSVRFGYRARRSHEVVDVAACPALAPELGAALPAFSALGREAAAALGAVRLTATLAANGIDAALVTAQSPHRAEGGRRRGRRGGGGRRDPVPMLASDDPAIIRISLNGETLLQREAPEVRFPGGHVRPPPGAFLQATREGEAALIQAVCEATGGATSVADLFCGVGTFALPLSRTASVLAVESDQAALSALDAAVRPPGAKPLRTRRRNLFRDPLGPRELAPFDAVVFDPPRAGANAQAQALAASAVPLVVAVSCEPSTLARDCAHLQAGGYKITQVLPVDQFVATAHIEAVAVMRRPS